MDVHASLRHLRMSPRKVRLVVNAVRGLSIARAEARLAFLKKGAAEPVLKLIRSAAANAEHNFKLDRESLVIKTITADGGPTTKRFRPRAFGRAAEIRKRTTHVNVILAPKSEVDAAKKAKNESVKAETPSTTRAVKTAAPRAKGARKSQTA